MKIQSRNEISQEYKWNIEAMYPVEDDVYADLKEGLELATDLEEFKGKVLTSATSLLNALELYMDANQLIEKAYIYAHMKKDEDNGNAKYQEMLSKAAATAADASAKMSYLVPELLEGNDNLIANYLQEESELLPYEHMLNEILLTKEHSLSSDQEFVLASLSEVLGGASDIYRTLNDVDLVFGMITDEDGNEVPLTHGNFIRFMESENREVRKAAYETLYSKYKEHNHTISAAYNNNVKTSNAKAKLRKYDSCLDAALFENKIPKEVYTNLVEAVHNHLPSMHKYVELRKKVLGVDELKMFDVYTPIVKPMDSKYTFEEAVSICVEALAPMGEEYVEVFRKGVLEERWVDIYENKGKTSGAYSFGSYESYPYILMNFAGELRDVFTLIHEGGHSMHSYYTRKNQPYMYGDHSIFTAEVASTVNETLLIKYLLDNCNDNEMKAYLINFYIDEYKGTLFRQTMFAEFELRTHEYVENGGSLTSEYLDSTYDKLNSMYFGDAMSHDDYIQYEWSRIPHFYRDFYVYQYATGYSAANAIANRIINEGKVAVEDYIKFLSSGSCDYPIELLKIAGVDMSTKEPVQSALDTFDSLVDQLFELV